MLARLRTIPGASRHANLAGKVKGERQCIKADQGAVASALSDVTTSEDGAVSQNTIEPLSAATGVLTENLIRAGMSSEIG